MTIHTTEAGQRPAETPWPIDRFNPDTWHGHRQRVLIEAEVFDDPDPEDDDPEDRYYVFAIANGDPNVQGRELLSIREDHVRATVRRIPEPAPEPTMVPAHALADFEAQVFGEWRRIDRASASCVAGETDLYVKELNCVIKLPSNTLVPARFPEDHR